MRNGVDDAAFPVPVVVVEVAFPADPTLPLMIATVPADGATMVAAAAFFCAVVSELVALINETSCDATSAAVGGFFLIAFAASVDW